MKNKEIIKLILFIFISLSIVSCKDSNEDIGAGVSGESWLNKDTIEIVQNSPVKIIFNAASSWSASSSSSWCKIDKSSGERGQNIIYLSTSTTSQVDRSSTITINVKGYSSSSFIVKQKATDPFISTENSEVNSEVKKYLSEMYLWNDEYKTLTLDITKDYISFFDDALLSMKTNTLDKKLESDGKYYIYSYIEKLNPVSKSRATINVKKELEYSFGITGITPVMIGTEQSFSIYFCIEGIHPDSPASEAGLKRGSMINKINGAEITQSTYITQFINLLYPSSTSTLTVNDAADDDKKFTITSKAMYVNPIILSKVDEMEGKKIGYLVYSNFDAGFDEELFNVFKDFKKQGVTDLILDLRYNGGGHTMSANLISSCIAGDYAKDKVFVSYRYNDERMKKLNNKRDEDPFATNKYYNLGIPLTDGFLGLKKIYCIIGTQTASSSELVINGLRGIDIDVVLIGEKSVGKNVGMEYKDVDVRNNTYRIVPITFQSYNAKGFGDYQDGFKPEKSLIIDETNPNNEQGIFYNFRDYGTTSEPLYAKAIELITGKKLSTTSRAHDSNMMFGKRLNVTKKYRPGFDGMLKKAKE